MVKDSFCFSAPFSRRICLFLCLLPALLQLVYIFFFGVNVPFWDEWDLVLSLDKMYSAHLTWGDLFAQHNEHRGVMPNIIMILVAHGSHFNPVALMYFSWLVEVVAAFFLFQIFQKNFRNSPAWAFLPVVWLFFSLRQTENILWGWQIHISLCLCGFILALYFLEKTSKVDLWLLGALLASMVASFSFANGLLVWIIGFYGIRQKPHSSRKIALVWAASAGVVFFLYFWSWQKPVGPSSPSYALEHPIEALFCLLSNIGSPLIWANRPLARAAGAVILLLSCLFLWNSIKSGLAKEHSPWVCLIFFSLSSSFLIMIGRTGLGEKQALASRYVSFTNLAAMGLYCLLLDFYFQKKSFFSRSFTRYAFSFWMVLICWGILSGFYGIRAGQKSRDWRRQIQKTILVCESAPSKELQKIYPDPGTLRERVRLLKKYRLSIFADP